MKNLAASAAVTSALLTSLCPFEYFNHGDICVWANFVMKKEDIFKESTSVFVANDLLQFIV